jgi:hypothetical protein
MEFHTLLDQVVIDTIDIRHAAGQADNPSAQRTDMLGFDGALFLSQVEVFAAGAVATFSIEESATEADPTAAGALTGASVAVTDTTGGVYDGGWLAINVYKPQLRYLAGTRIGTVGNVTWGPLLVIKYKGTQAPAVQSGAARGIIGTAVSVNSV